MRRGLLIVLTFTVLMSALPAAAAGPAFENWTIADLWSRLLDIWTSPDTRAVSSADNALPHLDPNGLSLSDPSGGSDGDGTLSTTELDPSTDALPHLDPNG